MFLRMIRWMFQNVTAFFAGSIAKLNAGKTALEQFPRPRVLQGAFVIPIR